jgi:hypothetical protein
MDNKLVETNNSNLKNAIVDSNIIPKSSIIVDSNKNIKYIEDDKYCNILDIEILINIIIGLFMLYLIYLFLYSCNKQNNNYEYMDNPDNNYILEQNMYKNLSKEERKNYINMDINKKMEYINNHL